MCAARPGRQIKARTRSRPTQGSDPARQQHDLVRAPIFRLLAIDSHEVVDALGELNRLDAIRFRMQGDIVELDIKEVA